MAQFNPTAKYNQLVETAQNSVEGRWLNAEFPDYSTTSIVVTPAGGLLYSFLRLSINGAHEHRVMYVLPDCSEQWCYIAN